jgi:hypothetical protein
MWYRNISAHVVYRTESFGLFAATLLASDHSQPRMQMKRNYAGYSYLSPFMLWSDLATKTLEMMLASAQVVGHRTSRMALAGPVPNARDRREFALMGQEKIEAVAQSAQAMVAHMMTMSPPWGVLAFRHLLQNAAAFMSLAGSRTPSQLIARQTALARALGQSAISMADVAKNATQLAHRGLKPIHARATANAKRLARR